MYKINTFFWEFFRAKFLLTAIFCLFLCLSVCGLWSPRPPAPVAAARGSGARGWGERLLETLGHFRGSGDTGQLAAGGQYPLLRLDHQQSYGCLTLASLLIGFTYLLYCCQIHRSCLPEPLLVDHGSTFRAWFDRIWHQSGFLVLFDSSLYRNYTICI